MSEKGGSGNFKKTKLDLLKEWDKIDVIYEMIQNEESPNQIAKYINDNGFKVSTPTVYTFVKQVKNELMQKIHADTIRKADKKVKEAGVTNIKADKQKPIQQAPEAPQYEQRAVTKVRNDIEVLDSIISLGMETLTQMEALSPQVAISAIRLKAELTDGDTTTAYGLEEIRLREQAREHAMLECIKEYVPSYLWDELLEKLEKETEKFYDSIGMGDSYRQARDIEGE